MRHILNTLYVTTPETYLAKEGECVCLKREGCVVARLPVHTLGGLVLFGPVSFSPFLLAHCAENGVAVTWLTENGRFLASMHGPVSGNVLLRRRQYRQADDQAGAASLAAAMTTGKIYNCRTILRRAARDNPRPELDEACQRLTFSLQRLANQQSLDQVRGLEGEAAQVYFSVFQHLIVSDEESFAFSGRNRRPPLDAVNCLLSFLYTLLVHDIRSALEGVGLDPAVGFLHRDRPGRPSLALDLMEEFRPYLADRLALTMINRGQLKGRHFVKSESGAVSLTDEGRKELLKTWQERKKDEIEHPFLGERLPVGLLWHTQARLLARHLRGDLDAYPPFVVR
jgi:CRISPR-associated protein Cas1